MQKQDVLVATLERDRPVDISGDLHRIELIGDAKDVRVRLIGDDVRISSRRRTSRISERKDREQEDEGK